MTPRCLRHLGKAGDFVLELQSGHAGQESFTLVGCHAVTRFAHSLGDLLSNLLEPGPPVWSLSSILHASLILHP
jgi:hypothetical protein